MFLISTYQSPIYPLILSVLLLVIVIRLQIINKKIMSNKLVWSFALVFMMVFITVFYDDLIDLAGLNSIIVTLIVLEITMSVMIYMAINNNYTKSVLTSSILESLDEDRYFVLLDKKNRIKESSKSIVTLFPESSNSLIGTDFLDLFFSKYDFVRVLDSKITKEEFMSEFYNDQFSKKFNLALKSNGENLFYTFNINRIYKDRKFLGTTINLEVKDSFWLSDIQNTTKELQLKYDTLLKQYKTTMNLSKDNYIFHNLETKDIWVNDNLHTILKIGGNNLSTSDFLKLFNQNDVSNYLMTLENLSMENPNYKVKYKIRVFGKEILVNEEGTRLYTKKGNDIIIGNFTLSAGSGYEKTNIKLIDGLKGAIELNTIVNQNIEKNKNQYIVSMELMNVKEINEIHSRLVGNMVIGEYIRFIRESFIDNDDDIVRLGGLRFVFVITNNQKMQAIRRALEKNESILHGTFNYTNIKIDLQVKMGISMTGDSLKGSDIIEVSERALEMAISSKQKSYVIYRDE